MIILSSREMSKLDSIQWYRSLTSESQYRLLHACLEVLVLGQAFLLE